MFMLKFQKLTNTKRAEKRLFSERALTGGPQGPPVIFSDNKVHTINIIIHFQIKLKNFLGPKILSKGLTL